LWDLANSEPKREVNQPMVLREQVRGGIAYDPAKRILVRITGKVRVIDAHTLVFADGTQADLNGGTEAPELEQQGSIDGKLYPCGKEAAEFLRKLIGDRPVTCYTFQDNVRGKKMRLVSAFLGEMRLNTEMARNGWAISDHSGMDVWEVIARQNKRGLWRGEFVTPAGWRKGERLPGEPPAAPNPKREANKPIIVMEGTRVIKISGKVKVIDAHTLRYEDCTELELNGGMDAPDLDQAALMGDTLYPWGKKAAEFLGILVGGRVVTCYVEGQRGAKLHGACFVEETLLEIEMVRNGWAVSHHTALDGWSMIAREKQRGIWQGKFIPPEDWRKGKRLPGEAGETASQRKAVAALQHLKPVITYDETKPGKPVIAIGFRPNTNDKVTDDDLAQLKSFPNLRSLDLPSSSQVTVAGLSQLAELRSLVELNVNWTKASAAGVVNLVKGRRMMQRLEVSGVNFRDEDLAMLKGLPYLKKLSLRATQVTDEGLVNLRPLADLQSLSLMSTHIGDSGLKQISSLATLEDLDLDRTAITDAGLKHLEGLRSLRRLQMAHTAITDAGLEHLRSLTRLKELNIRGTSVTKEAVDKLKQRVPGIKIGSGPAPK
jgi:endonuclease YncB( thermonuclease family)